jgi:hypothetical protein
VLQFLHESLLLMRGEVLYILHGAVGQDLSLRQSAKGSDGKETAQEILVLPRGCVVCGGRGQILLRV